MRSVWTAVFFAAAFSTPEGQIADKPDQITRKVRFRGGDDPNVKATSEVNVRKRSGVAAPAGKTAAAQAPCAITFDNQTDLFTRTFIDGTYAGTIRPFGALSASATPGAAILYARAEYDDGSADAWGPIRVNCNTKYLWRLTD
jgi:hypothetical protein